MGKSKKRFFDILGRLKKEVLKDKIKKSISDEKRIGGIDQRISRHFRYPAE